MNDDILLFFSGHTEALPLYERLEERIISELGQMRVKVQKSQISFYNRHLFACVSFMRVRRKKDCPDNFIVVTFGLEHEAVSPRIDAASEPYPNRWTHHMLISRPEEIDDELMSWLKEAYDFAAVK